MLLVPNGLTVNRNGAKFNNRFNTVRKQERERNGESVNDEKMEEQEKDRKNSSW